MFSRLEQHAEDNLITQKQSQTTGSGCFQLICITPSSSALVCVSSRPPVSPRCRRKYFMTRLCGRRGWPPHAAGPLDAVFSTPVGVATGHVQPLANKRPDIGVFSCANFSVCTSTVCSFALVVYTLLLSIWFSRYSYTISFFFFPILFFKEASLCSWNGLTIKLLESLRQVRMKEWRSGNLLARETFNLRPSFSTQCPVSVTDISTAPQDATAAEHRSASQIQSLARTNTRSLFSLTRNYVNGMQMALGQRWPIGRYRQGRRGGGGCW